MKFLFVKVNYPFILQENTCVGSSQWEEEEGGGGGSCGGGRGGRGGAEDIVIRIDHHESVAPFTPAVLRLLQIGSGNYNSIPIPRAMIQLITIN